MGASMSEERIQIAAAAMYRSEMREMDTRPPFRIVTGSSQVRYLKATPLGADLLVRGRVSEIDGHQVIIESTVSVDGVSTVRGEVVAIQMPDNFGA